MGNWIYLANGGAVTLFGCVLAASFCHVLPDRRKRRIFWCCAAAILCLQGVLAAFCDTEVLRYFYPLTVHLPLVLALWGLSRRPLWSLVSVLIAYLCCQIRRWLALLMAALLSGGAPTRAAVELILTLPLLLVLLKFVSPKVRLYAENPLKGQWQFGIIPLLYYLFDYAAVVYTDLLTGGSVEAAEFMPFFCCLAYLVFLLFYSAEEKRRSHLRQVQRSLDIQLSQSIREIGALRESQELTRRYRHDLRHHLQYVSACIENGQDAKAREYISGICREIEGQTVEQYCENEAANLILSAFAGRARKQKIAMQVQGSLPAQLPIPDSDLCVLLSNGLENALHACADLPAEVRGAGIEVSFFTREDRFFLQIKNPCAEGIRFEQGVPVSQRPGHGVGVQSICAIVERYGGMYGFSVREGQFVLQVSV